MCERESECLWGYVCVCNIYPIFLSVCLSIYLCRSIYIYIHTHTHTHTHTHMYMYMYWNQFLNFDIISSRNIYNNISPDLQTSKRYPQHDNNKCISSGECYHGDLLDNHRWFRVFRPSWLARWNHLCGPDCDGSVCTGDIHHHVCSNFPQEKKTG